MTKIVYTLFYAISLLPFWLLYCIADFEYLMMYYVIKYRRGIVRKNLTTSFPKKSEEEIIDIEKKFYHWFSDYFFEAVKLLSISDKELRKRFQVINSEEVEQCFQEGQNVAAILMSLGGAELKTIQNGETLTFVIDEEPVTMGIDLKSDTGIRFANGDGEQWRKEGKREWDKYTFGIYGCWVMDDDGNLDYVPEEEYTEELWNEQKKAAGRHASAVARK